MENNDLFWKEKLAIEFCNQYLYKGKEKEVAFNAFVAGIGFGLKKKPENDYQLPTDPYPTCHHCGGRMMHTMLESWCSNCGFISRAGECGWPYQGDENDLKDYPSN